VRGCLIRWTTPPLASTLDTGGDGMTTVHFDERC
jgi:hypothetical protein